MGTAARGSIAGLLVVLGLLGAGRTALRATPPDRETRRAAVAIMRPARPFAAVGAGSCAARACHGSSEPARRPADLFRGAYTTWVEFDAHSRAYQTLTGEASRKIIDRLGWPRPAQEEARCLACHATPSETLARDLAASVRQDGVSCEGCHGAAEGWLAAHTEVGWRDLSPARKRADYGMVPLEDLADRARACVGCHVGAPADPARGIPVRDMNHDMIAAGHPRLTFELAAYLGLMPRHWDESQPREGFRARAWRLGQAATAQAACELLASRAERSRRDEAPWPELSEYNCYACHFALGAGSRAGRRGRDDLGLPAWGSWTTARLRDLGLGGSELGELERAMRLATSTPEDAGPKATDLAVSLSRWLRASGAATMDPPDFLGRGRETAGWDDAAQLYLGLSALNRPDLPGDGSGAGRVVSPKLDAELKALREILKFPPGLDSPRGFSPGFFPRGDR